MKKTLFFLLVFALPLTMWAQDDNSESDEEEDKKISTSAVLGAVSAGGENWQQFGFRTDFPIGKLGFGLDIQLLFDANGRIRKDDWDQWHDYLDKIYYIRWARKKDPFYVKVGGLDYSYIGYNNIFDGYSNMVEYPTVRRYGMEMALNFEKFGAEILLNNFKEFLPTVYNTPGALVGGRVYYNVIGKLQVGASAGFDMNEFNGLKDDDKDFYPNEIDAYPTNGLLVTQYDEFMQKSNNDTAFVNMATKYGLIDPTRKEDLFSLKDTSSQVFIYSLDAGMPIINGDFFKMDVYATWTKINTYGWGITGPGLKFGIGSFINFKAEFRKQSSRFVYGFFNNTYEFERAKFVMVDNKMEARGKHRMLNDIDNSLNGFFIDLDINGGKYFVLNAGYQDMFPSEAGADHVRSLKGEFKIKENAIPMVGAARAYYIQNNVDDFRQWKTSSTVMGYELGYNMKGVVLGFDYRYNFQDLDASGKIDQDNETIKSLAVKTSVKF